MHGGEPRSRSGSGGSLHTGGNDPGRATRGRDGGRHGVQDGGRDHSRGGVGGHSKRRDDCRDSNGEHRHPDHECGHGHGGGKHHASGEEAGSRSADGGGHGRDAGDGGHRRDADGGGHRRGTDGEGRSREEAGGGGHRRGGRGGGRSGGRGGGRRRNERGQYVESATDEDLLALLDRLPGPVITTSDVAETFDITTEGARRKLNDLCDQGVLDRRKSGQTRVYWRVETE